MIVKRVWTFRRNDIGFAGGSRLATREGWFLFGVLPLYIREVE